MKADQASSRRGEENSGGGGKRYKGSLNESGRCKARGARDGGDDVVVDENREEGCEACGGCGACQVCEGEVCNTELGGFLSLQMTDRGVN